MTDFYKKPDFLVRTGSHLYGCSVDGSDEDTRGFVVPPFEYILGRKKWEQHETKEPDTVIWTFPKFFNLLERSSPNILELLFVPKEHILEITDVGHMLMQHRDLFICKQIFNPIRGFAFSEWKKAVDYFEQMRKLGAKRKSHIAEFGYSIKNAYHAIRLLDECIELLQTGKITFPRPNADFLRKIRNGEVEVEELKEFYTKLDNQSLLEYKRTNLPDNVDKDKLDGLYYSLISNSLIKFMKDGFDYPPDLVCASHPCRNV